MQRNPFGIPASMTVKPVEFCCLSFHVRTGQPYDVSHNFKVLLFPCSDGGWIGTGEVVEWHFSFPDQNLSNFFPQSYSDGSDHKGWPVAF